MRQFGSTGKVLSFQCSSSLGTFLPRMLILVIEPHVRTIRIMRQERLWLRGDDLKIRTTFGILSFPILVRIDMSWHQTTPALKSRECSSAAARSGYPTGWHDLSPTSLTSSARHLEALHQQRLEPSTSDHAEFPPYRAAPITLGTRPAVPRGLFPFQVYIQV